MAPIPKSYHEDFLKNYFSGIYQQENAKVFYNDALSNFI